MVMKLTEFMLTSKLLKASDKSSKDVTFDKAGKTAVNLAMLMPGLFVFRC
jgi:hypothetical protein